MAPAELETLLLRHPEVQDVAVIGVPDDRAGELPRAYVKAKANSKVTEEDLISFVKGNNMKFLYQILCFIWGLLGKKEDSRQFQVLSC